ncbi:hypothetical protein [Asticcacaulis excentricus]|uniref:Uncharacterized protein n=1 Tax=Asticcacaulis excentricus (strain ATCC 15261 / DSM 4724 / KCTC 12464 / NCIMB 9791 / VKM B-1370 / CB 48) TaxID=573065 RepID=E8RPX6_ASTEC|nr:hypothetical protein [Asticcacaulis excentricus]ADU13149.1 hypothetical protein Astex_1483 [Asticcacaulis excentricus CB 48]
MTIIVDIANRLYDYTDEEKAAEAIAAFQADQGLSDAEVLAIWERDSSSQRDELERRIFEAVDANGGAGRARDEIPYPLSLMTEDA